MFPLSADIDIDGHFTLPAQRVVKDLWPLLTPERQLRIEAVIQNRNFNYFPVLENIYDQGNTSAVLRSTEAMGFGQAFIIETQTRFKKSKRTTAGADKWLEVKKFKQSQACIEFLKKKNIQILATHLGPNAIPLMECDFSKPTALIFGNEKSGVSPEFLAASDAHVIIPQLGFVQSLNISVAAALGMWIIQQKVRANLPGHDKLTDEQKLILQAHYSLRSLDSAKKILRSQYYAPHHQGISAT